MKRTLFLCTLVVFGAQASAQTAAEQLNALKTRIQANAAKIAHLKSEIAAEQAADPSLTYTANKTLSDSYSRDAQITAAAANLPSHENKTKFFSVSGSNLYITGANLQLWSGTSTPNGKGNLILGFNAPRTGQGVQNYRTGSHNLIMGNGINYTSEFGIAGGYLNNLYSVNGVVLTGEVNTVTGVGTSPLIVSGYRNTVSQSQAVIVSGNDNRVDSVRSMILTGSFGTITGGYESVLMNGERNTIKNTVRGVLLTGNKSTMDAANNSVLTTGNSKTITDDFIVD